MCKILTEIFIKLSFVVCILTIWVPRVIVKIEKCEAAQSRFSYFVPKNAKRRDCENKRSLVFTFLYTKLLQKNCKQSFQFNKTSWSSNANNWLYISSYSCMLNMHWCIFWHNKNNAIALRGTQMVKYFTLRI